MIDQNSAVLEVRVSNCRSKSFAKSWLDYFFSKEQKKRFCGGKKCNETEVKKFEQKRNTTILNHIKHKNLTVRANPIFDPVFTLIDIWGLDFNQDSTCKLGFNPKIGIQPEYWDSTQRVGFSSNTYWIWFATMNINQGFAVDPLQFVVLAIILVLMIFFDILVLVVQGIFLFLLTVMVLALYVHNFWPKLQLLEFIMLVVLGILMVLLMALDLFFIVVQVSFMILVVFVDLFFLLELIAFLEEVEAMDQFFELLDRVDFDQVVWPVILQQFIIW